MEATTNGISLDADLHEDELGVTVGEPVDTGFVFHDGMYVEPPYVVTRRGMAVFINDVMVCPPLVSWPLRGELPAPRLEDLEIPDSINKTTSQSDPVLRNYLNKKMTYLRAIHDRSEAQAAIARAFRDLSCVRDAQVNNDPVSIIVTWEDGRTDRIRVIPPTRERIDSSRERLIQEMEMAYRRNYEDRLRKGDVYFFWSRGGRSSGGLGFVESTFPHMLAILRSTASDEEKIRQLGNRDAGEFRRDEAAQLVANFDAPPELDARLAKAIDRIQEERAARQREATSNGAAPE